MVFFPVAGAPATRKSLPAPGDAYRVCELFHVLALAGQQHPTSAVDVEARVRTQPRSHPGPLGRQQPLVGQKRDHPCAESSSKGLRSVLGMTWKTSFSLERANDGEERTNRISEVICIRLEISILISGVLAATTVILFSIPHRSLSLAFSDLANTRHCDARLSRHRHRSLRRYKDRGYVPAPAFSSIYSPTIPCIIIWRLSHQEDDDHQRCLPGHRQSPDDSDDQNNEGIEKSEERHPDPHQRYQSLVERRSSS